MVDLNINNQYRECIFLKHFRNNQNLVRTNNFSKDFKEVLSFFPFLLFLVFLILIRFIFYILHNFIMQFYCFLSNLPLFAYTIPAMLKILFSLILFFIKMRKITIHNLQKNFKYHLLFHYIKSIIQRHQDHLNLLNLKIVTKDYQ